MDTTPPLYEMDTIIEHRDFKLRSIPEHCLWEIVATTSDAPVPNELKGKYTGLELCKNSINRCLDNKQKTQ